MFLTNKRGFPALSKPHQALLAACFDLGIQVGSCRCLSGHHTCVTTFMYSGDIAAHVIWCCCSCAPSHLLVGTAAQPGMLACWAQVVVQDQTGHQPVGPQANGGAAGIRLAPATNGVAPAVDGQAAVLQPYFEYLSYLFRRPGHAPEQERMELAYRDHLQACPHAPA